MAIPNAPVTFGVLADGQAVGDLQALRAFGRWSVQVNLGSDHEAAIRGIGLEG